MAPEEPIDLYLCHANPDQAWTEALATKLEQEVWNGRKLRVFLDKWDIQPGENVISRMESGLKQSRLLAVVLSPALARADWANFEWQSKVYEDPIGRKARIIPILLRDRDPDGARLDIPLPLRLLSWLDFRVERSFSKQYDRLVRRLRNEPPPRGIPSPGRPLSEAHPAVAARLSAGFPAAADEPDPIQEVLISNLLPVLDYPKTVWSASTDARTAKDVWAQIKTPPPFRLLNRRLYCFEDLSKPGNTFASIIKRDVFGEPVGPWRTNPDKWRTFISLLNQAIEMWRRQHGFLYDSETGRTFFMPEKGGGDKSVPWTLGKRPRTVVKFIAAEEGDRSFFVHQGCRLGFETLGDRLFLSVDPCWVFTRDGRTPMRGKTVTKLAARWSVRQRNGAILRNLVFWATVLSLGREEISWKLGDASLRIRTVPATCNATVGIDGDRETVGTLLDLSTDDLAVATRNMQRTSLLAEALGEKLDGKEEQVPS